jgi:predicted DCC family thiol-disulfide oxidoreductase YuxK
MNSPASPVCVVIDGQCPICAMYGRAVSTTLDHSTARILDGRDDSAERRTLAAAGIDVDDGMVAITADGPIAGRAALVHLSRTLPPGSSWLLRLCAALFRHEALAVVAYPLFKAVRRGALWIKGVGPIR